MTVLLVIATFVVLLTLDYLYTRHALEPVPAPVRPREAAAGRRAGLVGGFELPEHLRYHPGHTWAVKESADLVRVGLDDFAACLAGPIQRIVLPKRGTWIRQGQRLCTLEKDGRKVEMVSPIEGIVADVNDALEAEPEAARRDPYGAGWIVTVQAPDAATNFRNLLGGTLARRWMEEAAARLRGRLPAMAGAVAQDGGAAVGDLTSVLPEKEWTELTREFFLA